jgi:hypothetical protein
MQQQEQKNPTPNRAVKELPKLTGSYATSFWNWTQHPATQHMRRSAPEDKTKKHFMFVLH